MTITRHEQSPILSNVVVHGNTVYTAGVVAKNLDADVAGQTDEVLKELDRLLKISGSDRTKILSATIWVPDIRLRAPLNEVWTKWADKNHLPARACIEAKLADPRALVEIAVIAAK